MRLEAASLTNDQLVDVIAEEMGGSRSYLPREEIVEELRRRLNAAEDDVFVLPVSISEAIRAQFGPGRRTFDAMTKRVRFAYKVWQGKYGPWTPEQADYAESVIVFCINKAVHGQTPGHSRASVYTWLDRAINHENTHEGFRLRAGVGVDITAHLKEALA